MTRMKRWTALFTIAMWVAALATPAVGQEAKGGCRPHIANSSNKTVTGTSGAITVAAAASLATPVGTTQVGGAGGAAAASTIGNPGAASGNGGNAIGNTATGGVGAVGAGSGNATGAGGAVGGVGAASGTGGAGGA